MERISLKRTGTNQIDGNSIQKKRVGAEERKKDRTGHIRHALLAWAVAVALILGQPVAIFADLGGDTFISQEYQADCEQVGAEFGICPELLEAIMETESSGNPGASNGNCKGLMQINVPCHTGRMAKLGVTDIYDPKGNIRVAADYLLELFQQYEDMGTVLMVYNGSSDALWRGEHACYTQYALKIMQRSWQLERVHGK